MTSPFITGAEHCLFILALLQDSGHYATTTPDGDTIVVCSKTKKAFRMDDVTPA